MDAVGFGIDVGSHAVKAVRLERRGGGYRLLAAWYWRREGRELAEMAPSIRAAVGKARGALVGLSGRDLIMRYIQVPRLDATRLAKVIEMEVAEYTSKSGRPVSHDYALLGIPSRQVDKFTIAIAIAADEELEKLETGLGACGISVRAVVPSSCAVYNSFVKFGDLGKSVTCLLDVGLDNTNLVMVRENNLYFLRNLNGGLSFAADELAGSKGIDREAAIALLQEHAQNLEDARVGHVGGAAISGVARIAAMIPTSLMFCRAQLSAMLGEVGRVVLMGGATGIPLLRMTLMRDLKAKVEVFDPSSVIETDRAPEAAAALLKDPSHSLAVAVGLAQMACDPASFSMTLVSRRARDRRTFMTRTLVSGLAIAATVVFLLLSLMVTRRHAGRYEERNRELEARLVRYRRIAAQMSQAEEGTARSAGRMDALQRRVGPGRILFKLLAALRKVIPEQVTISEIAMRGIASVGNASYARFVVRGEVEESETSTSKVLASFRNRLIETLGALKTVDYEQRANRQRGSESFTIPVHVPLAPGGT